MAYTRKFLDLSTDHLDAASREYLTGRAKDCSTYQGPYGWFAHCQEDVDRQGFVTEEATPVRPESLTAIFQHAIKHGCDYVLFDRDAERDPDLSTFDADDKRRLGTNEATADEIEAMAESGQSLAQVRCHHQWTVRDDNPEVSYCQLCGADGNA